MLFYLNLKLIFFIIFANHDQADDESEQAESGDQDDQDLVRPEVEQRGPAVRETCTKAKISK